MYTENCTRLACTCRWCTFNNDDDDPVKLFQARGKWWELIVIVHTIDTYILHYSTNKSKRTVLMYILCNWINHHIYIYIIIIYYYYSYYSYCSYYYYYMLYMWIHQILKHIHRRQSKRQYGAWTYPQDQCLHGIPPLKKPFQVASQFHQSHRLR